MVAVVSDFTKHKPHIMSHTVMTHNNRGHGREREREGEDGQIINQEPQERGGSEPGCY